MADVTRAAITEFVYKKLADPNFRHRLSARTSNDEYPIIVALREDPVSRMLGDLHSAGGSGNVVVPTLNGIMVIAIESDADDQYVDAPLLGDCTVGVFVERLTIDGGVNASYRFAVEGPDQRKDQGRAEVVAVAG